jgi:hypothetical protein
VDDEPVCKTLPEIDAEIAARDGRDVRSVTRDRRVMAMRARRAELAQGKRGTCIPCRSRKAQTAIGRAHAKIVNTILFYVYTNQVDKWKAWVKERMTMAVLEDPHLKVQIREVMAAMVKVRERGKATRVIRATSRNPAIEDTNHSPVHTSKDLRRNTRRPLLEITKIAPSTLNQPNRKSPGAVFPRG